MFVIEGAISHIPAINKKTPDGRFWLLAEGEGFEPSIELTPYTELATQRLQPLGHPSAGGPVL